MHNNIQSSPYLLQTDNKPLNVTFCPPGFVAVPSGKYLVKLSDIQSGEKGSFGQDIYVFRFEILEGKLQYAYINGFINKSKSGEYGVKNKLWKWVLVLTGKRFEEFDRFDLNGLIGKECVADIILEKKHINKIIELLPREEWHERIPDVI